MTFLLVYSDISTHLLRSLFLFQSNIFPYLFVYLNFNHLPSSPATCFLKGTPQPEIFCKKPFISEYIGKDVQVHSLNIDHHLFEEIYWRVDKMVDGNNPQHEIDKAHCRARPTCSEI